MSLHKSKKTALLHLCNCISSCDIKGLQELSSGIFFQKNIQILLVDSEKSKNISDNEVIPASEVKRKDAEEAKAENTTEELESKVRSEIETELASIALGNVSSTELSMDCDTAGENVQGTISISIDFVEVNEKNISEKFKWIEEFIDDRYKIKSDKIVSYSACMQANELELAKVAFFILSEVVNHLVLINNDNLKTLQHLDARVQEDLAECLNLFIAERKSITKSKVENILCHQAKYKTQTPPKSSFVTPRRNCPSKYKSFSLSSPGNDDIYTNSPLKSFFESPVFKREDIIKKEKEINHLRKCNYDEEAECENLKLKLNEAQKENEKKDAEIRKLKNHIDSFRSTENDSIEKVQEKCNSLQKELERTKKELKELDRENSELFSKKTFLENKLKDEVQNKYYHGENVIRNDLIENSLLEKNKKKVAKLTAQVKFLEKSLEEKVKEVSELNIELQNKKFEELKNISIYETKLKEAKATVENVHESPNVSGENIGDIIEEENKYLRLKLDEKELKIKELEEKLQNYDMVQSEGNHVSYAEDVTESSVMSELSETPKSQDSDEHFERAEENVDSTDVLNDTLVKSSNSVGSALWEEVPFKENTCGFVTEAYGALWENFRNSPFKSVNNNSVACMNNELSRTESSDTLEYLNLHSYSILQYKNGYNWNKNNFQNGHKKVENYLQMAQELTNVLKKKCEEFDKLAADFNALTKQSEGYRIQLEENSKIVEDLRCSLNTVENANRVYYAKYEKSKERTVAIQEKLKHYESLCEKLKYIDMLRRKEVEKNEDLLGKCKSYKKKKELETKSYQKQVQEVTKLNASLLKMNKDLENKNKALKTMIEDLDKQNSNLTTEVNELEKKFSHLVTHTNQLEAQLKKLRNFCKMHKIDPAMSTGDQSEEVGDKKEETASLKDIKIESSTINVKSEISLRSGKMEQPSINHKSDSSLKNFKRELPKKNVKLEFSQRSIESEQPSVKSESFFIDLNATASRDCSDESTLSGALRTRKLAGTSAYLPCDDEREFFNQSSLEDRVCEAVVRRKSILPRHLQPSLTDGGEDRCEELVRRNSILPRHLQSGYPVEMDLPVSPEKLYYDKNIQNSERQHKLNNDTKKRKYSELEKDSQSNHTFSTPVAKMKRKLNITPSSIKKFLFSRSSRPRIIKPKP